VKLLLDKGADIDVQGRFYYNTATGGHEQIVKLLLDKAARRLEAFG
jgi:hypothetical protein